VLNPVSPPDESPPEVSPPVVVDVPDVESVVFPVVVEVPVVSDEVASGWLSPRPVFAVDLTNALARMFAVDAHTQLPDDLLLLTDKMTIVVVGDRAKIDAQLKPYF